MSDPMFKQAQEAVRIALDHWKRGVGSGSASLGDVNFKWHFAAASDYRCHGHLAPGSPTYLSASGPSAQYFIVPIRLYVSSHPDITAHYADARIEVSFSGSVINVLQREDLSSAAD